MLAEALACGDQIFQNTRVTAAAYFTHANEMFCKGKKRPFLMLKEWLKISVPCTHLGMIPYTRLVLESLSSTALLLGTFPISQSALDHVRSPSSLTLVF